MPAHIPEILFNKRIGSNALESIWWRDLMKFDNAMEDVGFTQILAIKLGDGCCVPFWTKRWIGNYPFCLLFPALFQAMKETDYSVNSMGMWDNNKWIWSITEMNLVYNQAASEELEDLKQILSEIEPKSNVKDSFVWPLNEFGDFKVSAYYKKL